MANLVPYKLTDDSQIEVIFHDDTIWITQKEMARLFDVKSQAISKHLKNIFDDGELEKNSTCSKMEQVQQEGDREVSRNVEHYNLDGIISVGYRVSSQKATQFRIWANSIIKQYIRDGYVINEAVLRDDPSKLNALAAKIRELRATEKNIFAQVRECFKLSASDYEPNAQEVRSFYSLLQDKFHHAITKMTASKLIMDRANDAFDNMGLVNFKDLLPTRAEAKVGKNYLSKDELYRMYLLSEQFLLFAESSALMGKELTMSMLQEKLDDVLELNGFPVFDGYKDYIKEEAFQHAEAEYESFIELKKLEMHLGKPVDYLDYCIGEYHHLEEVISSISMKELKNHFSKKQDVIIPPLPHESTSDSIIES